MNDTDEHQIAVGISVSKAGQATVDPSLADMLFSLAVNLEETTQLPVDVQHVLAAIVLAGRNGEIDSDAQLLADDQALVKELTPHVKSVFLNYDGKVGADD